MKLADFTLVEPKNFTEASRILGKQSNAAGFPEDQIVYLYHKNLAPARFVNRRNLIVNGGTEEKPVRIYVESGMNTVEVVSGHAIIEPASGWGNVVFIHAGATVTIDTDGFSKITLEGEGTVLTKEIVAKKPLRDFTKSGVKYLVSAK